MEKSPVTAASAAYAAYVECRVILTNSSKHPRRRTEADSAYVSDCFSEMLLVIGHLHARKQGISCHSDQEDCAAGFAVKIVEIVLRKTIQATSTSHECSLSSDTDMSDAFLHRCAANHAKNFKRDMMRREIRCQPMQEDDRPIPHMKHQCAPITKSNVTPYAHIVNSELCNTLWIVFTELQPEPLYLFVARYIDGIDVKHLSEHVGRSEAAVRQSLYRTRCWLKKRFERCGIDEPCLRDYVRERDTWKH